jgi:hypothetical protein
MKNINFNNLKKVISWLLLSFGEKQPVLLRDFLDLLKVLEDIQNKRGPKGLIEFCKSLRGNLFNYFSGNNIRIPGVKLTKDGIPRVLRTLIPSVRRKQFLVIAIVLTILFSTRSLKLGRNPDFGPIEAPRNELPDLTKNIDSF